MHVSVSFEPSETARVSATISPDGLRVALVGRVPGATTYSFFVRSRREAVARPLLGTEGADNDTTAAFSPDGRWLAFTQQNHALKKIPVEGGPTTVLAEGNLRFTQLTWADNGMVLLTGFDPAHPGVIYAVPDSGGRPTPVAGAPGQADQVLGDRHWRSTPSSPVSAVCSPPTRRSDDSLAGSSYGRRPTGSWPRRWMRPGSR